MDYVVFGAGLQGAAITHDLLQHTDAKVTLTDANIARLVALTAQFPVGRVDAVASPLEELNLNALLDDAAVAVSALPYDHNLALTEAAIKTGTHFVDLGGNSRVVDMQFALDEEARRAGVSVIPDCGIAPGAVSILTAHGIDELGVMPNAVRIRVGGLPQHPQGPLGYMKVFSVHGLVNECKEPVDVLHAGARRFVEPMTGLEKLAFPEPFGEMEAAYTSGGSSTLTKTYEGRIDSLDYKTIRYPGHWEKMRTLSELGFFEEGSARELSERLIDRAISYDDEDALLLRISLREYRPHETARELRYTMVDLQDPATGHTAMQRTTGYSAAIIAEMLCDGRITERGVLRQELSVPSGQFLDEWAQRGLHVERSRSS